MAILNVTSDSFYDGGRHAGREAVQQHALLLVEQGADLIDVGCVSSRPGAILLPPEEEAARLVEAVTWVREVLPDFPISIDTCFSLPARRAVEAGADVINDISGGLFDPDMFATVADLQVPYVLSHNRVTPDRMAQCTQYDDLVGEVVQFLSQKLHELRLLGVADVWIDPGFGFCKTLEQNYLLLQRLDELSTLFNEPILVGVSRKSMIYKALDIDPDRALNGTTVLHTVALQRGARMLRVHDPREAREAIALVSLLSKESES